MRTTEIPADRWRQHLSCGAVGRAPERGVAGASCPRDRPSFQFADQHWRYKSIRNKTQRVAVATDRYEMLRNALKCFGMLPVSYTHLRAHEPDSYLVCRL